MCHSYKTNFDYTLPVKRLVITLIVFISVQAVVAPSSNAIFGLSTCEKMKKEILVEESIGKRAWQEYDTQRDAYVRGGAISVRHLIELLEQLTLVYNSDLIIFKKIDKNPKCTTASNSADVRAQIQSTKKELTAIEDSRKVYKKMTLEQQKTILPKSIISYLKTTYQSYGSIFSGSK